jgi:hypothetical protein
VSGLNTGISIAVYAVNRETGDRRDIKPKKHFDGEKLTGYDPKRYMYEPCRCKKCVPGGKQVESGSPHFITRGRGVIDSGGHYLESDAESPGLYICEPCGITLLITTYAPRERTGTVCGNCGAEVVEGPNGGYVCGSCYYTVTPDGSATTAGDAV